jgi:hypothetical protein
MSKLTKLFFILSFMSVLGSIVLAITEKKDFTWQAITFLWICSAYVSELRIKNLEDKL